VWCCTGTPDECLPALVPPIVPSSRLQQAVKQVQKILNVFSSEPCSLPAERACLKTRVQFPVGMLFQCLQPCGPNQVLPSEHLAGAKLFVGARLIGTSALNSLLFYVNIFRMVGKWGTSSLFNPSGNKKQKAKGKVVCLTKQQATKTHSGSEGIATCILNLGTS
jgi:hypothetical protein